MGVGALTSATRSNNVVSVSCPIAEIMGIFASDTALMRLSSLKGHKSSNDPPPRAIISKSGLRPSVLAFS